MTATMERLSKVRYRVSGAGVDIYRGAALYMFLFPGRFAGDGGMRANTAVA